MDDFRGGDRAVAPPITLYSNLAGILKQGRPRAWRWISILHLMSSQLLAGRNGSDSSERHLADLANCELNAEHLALLNGVMNESKHMSTQQIRRSIGLAVQW